MRPGSHRRIRRNDDTEAAFAKEAHVASDAPDRWERAEKPCEAYGRYRTAGDHGPRVSKPLCEDITRIPAGEAKVIRKANG